MKAKIEANRPRQIGDAKRKRKIIQIAISPPTDADDISTDGLYALCDDGTHMV
jgi:hypothetical protein